MLANSEEASGMKWFKEVISFFRFTATRIGFNRMNL